jgi:hypothetical protein
MRVDRTNWIPGHRAPYGVWLQALGPWLAVLISSLQVGRLSIFCRQRMHRHQRFASDRARSWRNITFYLLFLHYYSTTSLLMRLAGGCWRKSTLASTTAYARKCAMIGRQPASSALDNILRRTSRDSKKSLGNLFGKRFGSKQISRHLFPIDLLECVRWDDTIPPVD